MDLNLSGKTALIAGASKGMGAATARVFTREGARVVLLARDEQALSMLTAELRETGAQAEYVVGDLTNAASVNHALERVHETVGTPDVCIVSAGAASGGVFWDLADEVWSSAFDLKFMGMVRVLRGIAPRMKAAGRGRILAVVGNNGRQPHPRMLPGSAANAACLALIRGLAEELAPHGVTVNALNPGPTRTDRWDRLIENLARTESRPPAEVEAEQLTRMPKGRIGEPEEMAQLIAVLCSDLADMVTGTSLTADGGATKAIA